MPSTKTARIGLDEHVLITGMTGSGKSILAEVYLAGSDFPYVVMLDTKGQVYERRKAGKNPWRGLKEGKDFTVVEHLAELDDVKTPKIIYAPIWEEQTPEYYDSLMEWVYRRENTVLWIDELMEVAPSAMKYPGYLKGLYTRGRSKNSVIWACTQRSIDIPSIALGMSNHFFIFDMNQPQDRKKLADATGIMEFYDKPSDVSGQKYSFWYFRNGDTHAHLGKIDL